MSVHTPRVVQLVAEAATSGRGPRETIELALEAVCAELGFTSAAVYRHDEKRGELRAVAFRGWGERVPGRLAVLPLKRLPSIAALVAGDTVSITHSDDGAEIGRLLARELGISDIRWILMPLRTRGGVVGVAAFARGSGGVFSPELVSTLDVLSYQLCAMLLADEANVIADARVRRLQEDVRSSHAMLRAAETMSEKADLNSVLEALASVVHAETGRHTLVMMMGQAFPEATVAAHAGIDLRPGNRLAIGALDPVLKQSLMERRSVVVDAGDMPSTLGIPSGRFLSVPLIVDGALVGNIAVDDPPSDANDLTHETRLVEGVAFEAASAIANARLYERQRRSANLREALNDINAMLNESIERPDLLHPVIERAIEAFPADTAALALVDDEHWTVEYTAGPENLRPGDELPPADVTNAELALGASAPVLRPDESDRDGAPRASGLRGMVLVVPLRIRKRHFGAIFFRRDDWRQALDSETLDFASKLGSGVSLTLGNRYLYEHEHRVSETLQHALLSMPDHVPGLEMSHLYLAAAERSRVGGDFYDAFEMPNGTIALVIGDVSGKGLEAAAVTALVKNTLKAHLIEGLGPAGALERANKIIYQFSPVETFVTVFAGVLDPASGVIVYANGGHLPPLVFSREGTRLLEAEGALLGAFAECRYENSSARLSADETLLLYTDGLTEARSDAAELYGEKRLIEALPKWHDAEIGRIPSELMQEVEDFTAAGLSDDVAVLAVRLEGHRADR